MPAALEVCQYWPEWAVALSGVWGGRIDWGHAHQAGSLGTKESEAHAVCLLAWGMTGTLAASSQGSSEPGSLPPSHLI